MIVCSFMACVFMLISLSCCRVLVALPKPGQDLAALVRSDRAVSRTLLGNKEEPLLLSIYPPLQLEALLHVAHGGIVRKGFVKSFAVAFYNVHIDRRVIQ